MANEEAPAAEAAAPSKPKLPMLIGMVAVGLAVGGGTGAVFLGPMVAKKMGKGTPVVAHADSASADSAQAEGGHGAEGEGGAEGKGAAAAPIYLLENLVLNPAGSNGGRFLLISVAMEVGSAKAGEDFKNRDAELRDIILTALGTKSVDELTDISYRDGFKKELQTAVTARFGKNSVKSLYFPQFVVQ
ncbi:MAG: flagellar basal body-associated FliL family protein [Gemmatimonadaceae bacterium]|nr:flagellar basal body-associated FliL family protein [Gemmatimonadaceae bacterium]